MEKRIQELTADFFKSLGDKKEGSMIFCIVQTDGVVGITSENNCRADIAAMGLLQVEHHLNIGKRDLMNHLEQKSSATDRMQDLSKLIDTLKEKINRSEK